MNHLKSMRYMRCLCLASALLFTNAAIAVPTLYFGEDIAANHQLPGQPNSNAARDAFTRSLSSTQTEGFDNPGQILFGDPFYSVTTSFGNLSNFLLPGYELGIPNALSCFSVGGVVSSDTGFIANLNVSANGFGFFATDFGDEVLAANNHAQATVTMEDGTVTMYEINNSTSFHGELDGSVFFWGLVDADHLIQSVQIKSDNWWWDGWQVDDITTGTRNIPDSGSTAALLGMTFLVIAAGSKVKPDRTL